MSEVKGAAENVNENAVVQVEEKQVAIVKPIYPVITGPNYAEVMVQVATADFLAVNDGLDLDFVRMGSYIKMDKKGKFYDADDESHVFGENLDVVIIAGEQRFMLWGDEKSPYKGTLIAADRDENKARAAVDEWLVENPDGSEWHSPDDVALRYVAYVVPTESVTAEGPPDIYLLTMPTTGTLAFGKYAQAITKGRYKGIGVPARSTAKHVVTRVTAEDAKSRSDASISYLALKFQCLGLFKPEEYGINIDEVNDELKKQAEEAAAESATAAANQ